MDEIYPKDGLIHAALRTPEGAWQALDWTGLNAWIPKQGLLWAHLDYTHDRALAWLTEQSGIHEITVDALTATETRPRIIAEKNALLVVLRGINLNPDEDPEDMVSLRLWMDEQRIITTQRLDVEAVRQVHGAILHGRGPETQGEIVSMLVERLTGRLGEFVDDIEEQAWAVEDSIVTTPSRTVLQRLANIRRAAITLRRHIVPQRDVLLRLGTERITFLDDHDRLFIREYAELTTRYIEDLESARATASVTHEELMTLQNTRITRVMYVLSMVAAIFLPLTFFTGLLGINVAGIPGADKEWAFFIVCAVLAVIAVIEYLLFKRRHWL